HKANAVFDLNRNDDRLEAALAFPGQSGLNAEVQPHLRRATPLGRHATVRRPTDRPHFSQVETRRQPARQALELGHGRLTLQTGLVGDEGPNVQCAKGNLAIFHGRECRAWAGNPRRTKDNGDMSAPLFPRLILASTSPYRRELLQRLGLPFARRSPQVDEGPLPCEAAAELALRLALAKAQAVAKESADDVIVIGSDQVAELAGGCLGKPGSHDRAVEQL